MNKGCNLGRKPFSRHVYCRHLLPSLSFMHETPAVTFSTLSFCLLLLHVTSSIFRLFKMNTVINVWLGGRHTDHAAESSSCHSIFFVFFKHAYFRVTWFSPKTKNNKNKSDFAIVSRVSLMQFFSTRALAKTQTDNLNTTSCFEYDFS